MFQFPGPVIVHAELEEWFKVWSEQLLLPIYYYEEYIFAFELTGLFYFKSSVI